MWWSKVQGCLLLLASCKSEDPPLLTLALPLSDSQSIEDSNQPDSASNTVVDFRLCKTKQRVYLFEPPALPILPHLHDIRIHTMAVEGVIVHPPVVAADYHHHHHQDEEEDDLLVEEDFNSCGNLSQKGGPGSVVTDVTAFADSVYGLYSTGPEGEGEEEDWMASSSNFNGVKTGVIVAVEEDSLSSTEVEEVEEVNDVNKMVKSASSTLDDGELSASRPLRQKVPSSLEFPTNTTTNNVIVATEEDSGDEPNDDEEEAREEEDDDDDDTVVRGSTVVADAAPTTSTRTSPSNDDDGLPTSTTELRRIASSRERPMPNRSSFRRRSSYGNNTNGDSFFTSPIVDFNKRGSLKVLPKPDVSRLQHEQLQRTMSMKMSSSVSMPEMTSTEAQQSPSIKRRNSTSSTTRVSFDKIIIREHRRTMGDNPSCSYGTPIGLDWEYIQHADLTLQQYEDHKRNSRIRSGGKPRTLRQLHLNHYQRRNLLQLEGYTLEQIKSQKKETNKVRKQREMTRFLAQAPVLVKLEDMVESGKRKLFRRKNNNNGGGGSNGAKAQQQQQPRRSSSPPLPPPSPSPPKQQASIITLQTVVADSKATVTATTTTTRRGAGDELNDSNGTATTVGSSASDV